MKEKSIEIEIQNHDIMSYTPMQVNCAFCEKNSQCTGFDACPIIRTAYKLEPKNISVKADKNRMYVVLPAFNKPAFKRFCKAMTDAIDACTHAGRQR